MTKAMKEVSICNSCSNIILKASFYSPKDYEKCLSYIKKLLQSGNFEVVEKNCEIDRVKDENDHWVDDIIFHTIKCKSCGQVFTCSVNTYRGSGCFKKGR